MTEQELRQRIFAMTEPASKELRADIGGTGDRERLIQEFRENPRMEKKLAALLFLPMQEERLHKATLDSAQATVDGASHAKEANFIAEKALKLSLVSNIVAMLALFASVISLYVSFYKD